MLLKHLELTRVQKEKEKEKNEVALTEKKLLRNKPDANYNIYIPV